MTPDKVYAAIETDWSYDAVARRRERFMAPSLRTFTGYERPLLLKRGQMQYVWDETGARYLDCVAQNFCVSVGHNHPLVVRQAMQQAEAMVHCTTVYHHAVAAHLAEELVATMPAGDWVVHFVNSGSEAVDVAVLMARLYTQRAEILALRNSFHGTHFGSMFLTGIEGCHHAVPPPGGILHVDNPDQYRGAHGATVEPYVRGIDEVIRSSTAGQIAGFIVEPIQGYGGVIPLPAGYLAAAFERVRAAGGVCIVDEIQTGFGRTGAHFWGFERHGVVPDVVLLAKGIANGFPLAAVVARREVAQAMAKRKFFNTYGSNPVCCAAGRAVLRAIAADGAMEVSRRMGELLVKKLRPIQSAFDFFADVRGEGLMLGVEIVRDRTSKEPAPQIAGRIAELAKEKGLIVGRTGTFGNVLRINPPMCVGEEDVEFIAQVLQESCWKL